MTQEADKQDANDELIEDLAAPPEALSDVVGGNAGNAGNAGSSGNAGNAGNAGGGARIMGRILPPT